MDDPTVDEDVAINVGDAECERSGTHSCGLDKVIVVDTVHGLIGVLAGEVFKTENGVAVVPDLYCGPPLVTPVFEVVDDGAGDRAPGQLPLDGDTSE